MADSKRREESQLVRMYRENTKRLRRKLLDNYLMAMKEDLVEWLSGVLDIKDLNAGNFMRKLDNGVLLCEHSRILQKHAESYATSQASSETVTIPKRDVVFRKNGAFHGSFIARDNVSNFIAWCRDLGIPEVVLFETEDLVLHKNEKAVILTLLELARKGAIFGMKPPKLIELEEEIEREIEAEKLRESLNEKETIVEEGSHTFEKENPPLEKESLTLEKESPKLDNENFELEKENSSLEKENVLLEKASLPTKKESIPLKKESLPIKRKSLPIKRESLPIKKESLPIKRESLPIKTESLPIKRESLPIKNENLPIEKESLPIKTESLPIDTGSLPNKTESLSIGTQSLPIKTENPPLKPESLPSKTESLPIKKGSLPTEQESLPINKESFPIITESFPIKTESLPVTTENSHIEKESLPIKTQSLPFIKGSLPIKTESVPIEQDIHSSRTESLPIEQESLPVKKDSLPTEQGSLPIIKESLPFKQESLPIEKENCPIEKESIPVKIEIIRIEKESPPLLKENHVKSKSGSPTHKKEVFPVEKEYDLDELVQEVVDTCSCSTQFRVRKLGVGRYKFGKCKQIIFVRVMRNHVMVRVGGGWDTLEHFVQKHDPCRLLVGGYVDYTGSAQKLDSSTASAIMDFSSDEASACSSESFWSLDGGHLGSPSPELEDGKPYCSFGPSVSRQSSLLEDSDDEFNYVRGSRSEPIVPGKLNGADTKDYISQSKSETFTKFGARQLSLLSENLTDTDVYATRNPNDSWLRNHLNKRKQASKVVEGGGCLHKEEQLADGKENKAEENANEKLTMDSIKKKYGKPVKSQRATRKGGSISSAAHKRTVTSPIPKTVPVDGENVPGMQARNYPHYQSWDQSLSAPKKRKDGMLGTRERSDLGPKGRSESRETLPVASGPDDTLQNRPSFYKGYTVDSAILKRRGIRRRGEETSLKYPDVKREISADCIERRKPSRLPVPTFRKTGVRSRTIARGSFSQSLFEASPHTRNPLSRSASNDFGTNPRNDIS